MAGIIGGLLIVLVAGGYALFHFGRSLFNQKREDLITHQVQPELLELTVVEKGNLEAAENKDVICQVKAGGRGSNFATTIKWIIDDGTLVKTNRPSDQRQRENGENIRGDWVWPHTPVSGVPSDRRGRPLSREEKDVLAKAKRGEKLAKDEQEVFDYAKQFEESKSWCDLLVELDAAGLEDQERTQLIAVSKAQADKIAAEGQLKIVISENESAKNQAQIALDLAQIDFEKYTGIDPQQLKVDFAVFARKGFEMLTAQADAAPKNAGKSQSEFLQQLNDIRGKIKKSEADREMINERKSWMERMLTKKYASANQAEAEQNRLLGADLDLRALRDQESVLTGFTWRREVTDRWSKWEEAKRALTRAIIQNDAKLKTATNDDTTKQKLLDQEIEKLKDLREQIAHCLLFAPSDGMVVYFQSQQESSGRGSQQSTIAQGEPVREGQKLIRIPKLEQMLVSTRVHEAMVSRVKPGMPVDVRVDAFPDRVLKAKVRTVATVAMPPDWRSSAEVKMYMTTVMIEESMPGLKPGMTAECTVRIEATKERVLAVPVQAVVGGAEMGHNRTVFVRNADGSTDSRQVTLGLSNEKMAEVRTGLQAGEMVVLNPKVLLGDRAKTRQPGDLENRTGSRAEGETKGDAKASPAGNEPKDGSSNAPKGKGKGSKNNDEMKKKMQEFDDRMKKATPQERKQMLELIPEQFRDATKQRYKAQGLEIPD